MSIRKAHEDLLSAIVPVMEGAKSELMTKKTAGADKTALKKAIELLRQLLEIQAEGNLLAGVLTEASLVTDAARLEPLRVTADPRAARSTTISAAMLDANVVKDSAESLYERLAFIPSATTSSRRAARSCARSRKRSSLSRPPKKRP